MGNKRIECLELAQRIVSGDRQEQYGTPEDNFKVIADMWNAYWKGKESLMWNAYWGVEESMFLPEDVAMMMALLKIARIATGAFKKDSLIDMAGYAACAYEVADKKNRWNGDDCVSKVTAEDCGFEV